MLSCGQQWICKTRQLRTKETRRDLRPEMLTYLNFCSEAEGGFPERIPYADDIRSMLPQFNQGNAIRQ